MWSTVPTWAPSEPSTSIFSLICELAIISVLPAGEFARSGTPNSVKGFDADKIQSRTEHQARGCGWQRCRGDGDDGSADDLGLGKPVGDLLARRLRRIRAVD